MLPIPQPYPAYKPSAVEWHGDVPEHWETIRISAVARGGPESFTDGDWVEIPHITDRGVRLIQTGNVGIGVYREQGFRYINEQSFSELRCTEVNPGDVLICRLANPVGRACLAPDLGIRMITSVDVCILKPSERFSAQYLVFLLSSQVYLDYVASIVRGGTRDRISRSMLAAIKITNPPLPEQRAIVRYLDHVDDRIRRYVSAKEKLIALLEEERQAVIHRAVTRGLDPNVPLKPSGVEWLGDVPAHWELWRLKRLSQIRYGLGQPPRDSADGLPLIRATNVSRGNIIDKDMVYVDPADVPTGRNALLSEREIIVVRSGAYTADSAIIPSAYSGAVTGYDMVVTVTRALPEFIASVLLATYFRDDQLIVASMRSAQPHLNAEELGSAVVLLPPVPEQTAIVEHLDMATAGIDAAISRARRQIELLREYRTRLIADVVTGKLDVRDAAASLPQGAGE